MCIRLRSHYLKKYINAYRFKGKLGREDYIPIFFIDLVLPFIVFLFIFGLIYVFHAKIIQEKVVNGGTIRVVDATDVPIIYNVMFWLYYIMSHWPQIRRLNDTGRSWLYVFLIPVPFCIYKWYLLFQEGEEEKKRRQVLHYLASGYRS